jgi:hypothetical protein
MKRAFFVSLGLVVLLSGCSQREADLPAVEHVPSRPAEQTPARPAEQSASGQAVAIAAGDGSVAINSAHDAGRDASQPIRQVAIASGKGSVAMNAAGDINSPADDEDRPTPRDVSRKSRR